MVLLVAGVVYAKKKELRDTIKKKVSKSADDYFWNGYLNTYTMFYLRDTKGNTKRLFSALSRKGNAGITTAYIGLGISNSQLLI